MNSLRDKFLFLDYRSDVPPLYSEASKSILERLTSRYLDQDAEEKMVRGWSGLNYLTYTLEDGSIIYLGPEGFWAVGNAEAARWLR